MNVSQWKVQESCPNCKERAKEPTPRFSGMISYMIPTSSWVAKYNKGSKKPPMQGVYAIHVFNGYNEENDGAY